ncbi:NTP transferase domain-containing protein [Gracilibacillus sp. JCM 18860]|uniref:NTP transferase domain-containing protein n=1 Tax=Gracilibacillus sp. JCM 18860 TaxID=1306159 RepID=UPI0006CF7809
MDTIIGIVLAGGKSRRFGSPKAFAELNGVPFYCYPVQILSRLCSSVYVVARQQDFDRFNLRKKELLMEDHPDFLGGRATSWTLYCYESENKQLVCSITY